MVGKLSGAYLAFDVSGLIVAICISQSANADFSIASLNASSLG